MLPPKEEIPQNRNVSRMRIHLKANTYIKCLKRIRSKIDGSTLNYIVSVFVKKKLFPKKYFFLNRADACEQ